MNKKEVEMLFEQALGENSNIHIDMQVEPYSDLCLEHFDNKSYHDWVKDGSFDLKQIKIRALNKEELIAAIDLILFAEDDVMELGFDKTALYLDDTSGSLSHITNLILDEGYQKRCCRYDYEAKHCMPFSGELRTLYIARAYRKRHLGGFFLKYLNKLLEYEFRIHVCSLVVFLHPFFHDRFMGGYTDYANDSDRKMLVAMQSFYKQCQFVRFTGEENVYLRQFDN